MCNRAIAKPCESKRHRKEVGEFSLFAQRDSTTPESLPDVERARPTDPDRRKGVSADPGLDAGVPVVFRFLSCLRLYTKVDIRN